MQPSLLFARLLQGSNSSDWVLDVPPEEEIQGCAGSIGQLVLARSIAMAHLESELTCQADGDLLARLRYWEVFKSLLHGGASAQCFVTGVLWRTGRPGAVNMQLSGNLMTDLRTLVQATWHLRHEPCPSDEGFVMLEEALRCSDGASPEVCVRVGHVPEMPIATIRGVFGWDTVRLCALDAWGMLGLPSWLQGQEMEAPRLPPTPLSAEVLVQQLFLCGRLATSPKSAPSGVGPWLLSTERCEAASRIDVMDRRYVLWIPGVENAAHFLQKGLADMKKALAVGTETRKRPMSALESLEPMVTRAKVK